MSLEWNNEQTRILIDERKMGNEEYHRTPNRNKRNFWEKIAEKLNETTKAYYEGTKNKRSLVGEQYYEEFSTEFWKEPGMQRPLSNTTVSTTSSPTPLTVVSDGQSSSESLNSFKTGSDTSSKQTKSSRPVTPSIETPVVSRPVTLTIPSFSQNANVINVTINYGSKGSSSEEQ
ncbi:hypothetical protein C1645_880665 [Glomus cerebriforme]|uniref:Myb/SANT-like domain-containing protein n=1 Tax=Glomus cerebriforme TaxID=658196 RepID=A0A397SKR4_9GLOM|nr:hypothetical protein C1645_880665 [Glomus cerebriforme]